MPESTNFDLEALAHDVALALGEGWQVGATPGYPGDPVHLDGPDGAGLSLAPATYKPDKVQISGVYPPHDLDRSKHPGITVSVRRGGELIAREISRRLLPPYLAELAEVLASNATAKANRGARLQLAYDLAACLGGHVLPEARHATTTRITLSQPATLADRTDGFDVTTVDVDIAYAADQGTFTASGLNPEQLRALCAAIGTPGTEAL